ncbi:hypothetical protein PSTG_14720 [Puccinia striiformis f. sp. tritici PST-78]|uniref:Dynein 2 heavy chain 1 cytoplasmic ATPase lid domain-containing protein n=1 Tax=Puccinia striiformis f. sp. tritici PST-78 TaxID=1165861 RepID=A0A0L0UY49_9BASI|nr:hypothetical protein PSTG_14720 [Puccinia striiformis f. sp. tritici PST-78]
MISFLRQLVEAGGFWRPLDATWIKLDRIQFVGACNPPTDPGLAVLTQKFLRHAPLVMVDYPGEASLNQIYGTFNTAALKVVPNLRGHTNPLTSAMVECYLASQKRFTSDIQACYIYKTFSLKELIRIWAREALRLFPDRLVSKEEKIWTWDQLHLMAQEHFPNFNSHKDLMEPILFSNWTSKDCISLDKDGVKARLSHF